MSCKVQWCINKINICISNPRMCVSENVRRRHCESSRQVLLRNSCAPAPPCCMVSQCHARSKKNDKQIKLSTIQSVCIQISVSPTTYELLVRCLT